MAGLVHGYLAPAIEAALVLLLVFTLWRAARLERALGVLRGERNALIEALSGFRDSAVLTEQGVGKLRALTEGAGRMLTERVGAAEALQSDLAYMIERGAVLADRLEEVVRTARTPVPAQPEAEPEATRVAASQERSESNRERQLLRALGLCR